MGEKLDEAKGRTKEATGAITGDDELKREGKVDRFSADVKGKTNDAVDKVTDTLKKDR